MHAPASAGPLSCRRRLPCCCPLLPPACSAALLLPRDVVQPLLHPLPARRRRRPPAVRRLGAALHRHHQREAQHAGHRRAAGSACVQRRGLPSTRSLVHAVLRSAHAECHGGAGALQQPGGARRRPGVGLRRLLPDNPGAAAHLLCPALLDQQECRLHRGHQRWAHRCHCMLRCGLHACLLLPLGRCLHTRQLETDAACLTPPLHRAADTCKCGDLPPGKRVLHRVSQPYFSRCAAAAAPAPAGPRLGGCCYRLNAVAGCCKRLTRHVADASLQALLAGRQRRGGHAGGLRAALVHGAPPRQRLRRGDGLPLVGAATPLRCGSSRLGAEPCGQHSRVVGGPP